MSIVLAALLLAVLIILHEAGHFAVARACGMRVVRFSVGFGPKIASFRPKGSETTYQLSAIPLGGYVQIAGMDPHEPFEPTDRASYASRPLWQRALVVFAGPGANYVVAAVAFSILYAIGFPTADPAPVLGTVAAGGPADRAGLRSGDRILSIDGRKVGSWLDIAKRTNAAPRTWLTFRVRRDGRELDLRARPGRDARSGKGIVGIGPVVRNDVRPGFGAVSAGFRKAVTDAVELVTALGRMMTGTGAESLMGPIGIISLAKDQIERGIRAVLQIAGGLSVALAVMNFLPLPALDGGRLIFLGYEVAARRRVPARFEAVVHWVGLILLLGLLAVITLRDILVAAS